MNNYDKIKATSDMGYSGIIELISYEKEECIVVGISGNLLYLKMEDGSVIQNNEEFKIISYIYTGELLGSGEIPEGQRFRVKATGDVGSVPNGAHSKKNEIVLQFEFSKLPEDWGYYDKSEIEPYFD